MIWINLEVNINKQVPNIVKKATMRWLEYEALWFEREWKLITTREDHIITGRYRASINLNNKDKVVRQTVKETKAWDWIHEENLTKLSLKTWTNVEYAASLEKRYWILWRALDNTEPKFEKLFSKWFNSYIEEQWRM